MPTKKTIRVKTRSKRAFKGELRKFASSLTDSNPTGPAAYFWAAFAESLFSQIHIAFMEKSDGGKDNLGKSWKPLKRSTIAARPLVAGERKKLGILGLGRSGRGLLTAAQNVIWKGIFANQLEKLLIRGVSLEEAKILAAKLAWGIMKKRGVKTKREILGNRKVPILIDSGKLEESLRPGNLSGDTYDVRPDQIFSVSNGAANLGTTVEYAKYVHKTRPLWPVRVTPWIAQAVDDGIQNTLDHLGEISQ